ncbi:MAG TPA: hypothetical protein VIK72_18025 [Clostridiaceae bacterium]
MYLIPPLRHDELFQSWLISICQYNDLKIYCSSRIKELRIRDISSLKSEDILNICRYPEINNRCNFVDVIYKHTIFPYITAFSDSSKILWERIKKNYLLYLDNAKNYHQTYFNLSNPKVCIHCINEESNTFGGAYIHRTYQIVGNYFCIKHDSKLKVANEFYNHTGNYLNLDLTDLPEFDNVYTDKLKVLSKDIYSVINGILSSFTIEYIKMIIWIRMEEKGYIYNMIVKSRFFTEFNEYHDYFFLEQLNNVLYPAKENIFDFKKLILSPGASASAYSPIQIILIIRMLFDGGLREFIYYSKKTSTYEKLDSLIKKLKQKVYIDLYSNTDCFTLSENMYKFLLLTYGEY